jgi:hypothetical protein
MGKRVSVASAAGSFGPCKSRRPTGCPHATAARLECGGGPFPRPQLRARRLRGRALGDHIDALVYAECREAEAEWRKEKLPGMMQSFLTRAAPNSGTHPAARWHDSNRISDSFTPAPPPPRAAAHQIVDTPPRACAEKGELFVHSSDRLSCMSSKGESAQQ